MLYRCIADCYFRGRLYTTEDTPIEFKKEDGKIPKHFVPINKELELGVGARLSAATASVKELEAKLKAAKNKEAILAEELERVKSEVDAQEEKADEADGAKPEGSEGEDPDSDVADLPDLENMNKGELLKFAKDHFQAELSGESKKSTLIEQITELARQA